MIGLDLTGVRRVLFLGAHCDDIEIGVGATVLRLARERPCLQVRWIVFSGDAARRQEATISANTFLSGVDARTVTVHAFRDARFPSQSDAIKTEFEALKPFAPDLIFTHAAGDAHQDHRTVNELTWNTFRGHTILEYEIPKYDADLGRPNVFAPAAAGDVDGKIERLMRCFPSQTARGWYDEETFRGLMRIRGVECQSPTRYAEAFHARKILL